MEDEPIVEETEEGAAANLEGGAETAERQAAADRGAYVGSLATSSRVERVLEARSSSDRNEREEPLPLATQGMLVELGRQAMRRSRRTRLA